MMKIKPTIIAAFLVLGLVFIGTHDYSYAQGDFGCCRSVDAPNVPAGECVGCEGENCIVSGAYCTDVGGFIRGGTCVSEPEGAICDDLIFTAGCCAVSPGQCIDDVEFDECVFVVEGILLAPGESCAVIELCDQEPRNVPTLGEWGLIAMAGILGLIGFIMVIRRREAIS